MQDTNAARIADEDQKMIGQVQATFHEMVVQAEADYKLSVARQLAQGRAESTKSSSSDHARG